MKRFLVFIAAILLATPAFADGWTVGEATVTPDVRVDQTFTYAFTVTGETTTHQDLRTCGPATITIPTDTIVQFLDCPAADSDRVDCKVVAELPDRSTENYRYTVGAKFQKGFAMLRITDAVPTGNVTMQCTGATAEYSTGGGWAAPGVVDAETFSVQWPDDADLLRVKAKQALTLNSLDCHVGGVTVPDHDVDVVECDSDGASCVDSGLTITVAAVETNYNDVTATDAAVDEGDWWGIDVDNTVASGEWVHCTVGFTR